jgi:hypothetical protein
VAGTADTRDEDVPGESAHDDEGQPRSGRGARTVLVCAVAASVPFYLFFARRQWFWGGEWTFLASRDLSSLHDLLRPYRQHWETIPIVIFQLIFFAFRLRSYVPYQLPVIVLHGVAGVLLWIVIRRSGVHPWLATIAAVAFVYFGHGRQDIVLAFQLGFVSALVLGLCAVLLVDHPGRADRRDVLAGVCSALALLCSGVAVTMIAIAAIVMFVRRGIKPTLLYVTPLAFMYLVWYLAVARADYAANGVSPAGTIIGFVGSALATTLNALGSNPVAAFALAGLLLVGLFVAARTRSLDSNWTLPLAFAAGALVFLMITAFARASGGSSAVDQSRYLDIAACLLLPPLAKSADFLSRRYRYAAPIVLAVLLVGLPGNLVAAGSANGSSADRAALVAIATSPIAGAVDGRHVPDDVRFPSVSVNWLRREVGRSGLPQGTAVDRSTMAMADVRLEIQEFGLQPRTPPCHWLKSRFTVFLRKHDDVSFLGREIIVSAATSDGEANVVFESISNYNGATLRAAVPIEITLHPAAAPVQVCSRATAKNG